MNKLYIHTRYIIDRLQISKIKADIKIRDGKKKNLTGYKESDQSKNINGNKEMYVDIFNELRDNNFNIGMYSQLTYQIIRQKIYIKFIKTRDSLSLMLSQYRSSKKMYVRKKTKNKSMKELRYKKLFLNREIGKYVGKSENIIIL